MIRRLWTLSIICLSTFACAHGSKEATTNDAERVPAAVSVGSKPGESGCRRYADLIGKLNLKRDLDVASGASCKSGIALATDLVSLMAAQRRNEAFFVSGINSNAHTLSPDWVLALVSVGYQIKFSMVTETDKKMTLSLYLVTPGPNSEGYTLSTFEISGQSRSQFSTWTP